MHRVLLSIVTLASAAALGCGSDTLETGYAYQPLGDSSAKRRSYYADPFSPEARAAQQELQQQQPSFDARRAMPGN